MKPSIRTYYIFLSSLALAFLYSYMFVGKTVGVSGVIFYSLVILDFWVYKLLAKKNLNAYDLVLGLNVVLSLGFLLHQNKVLNNFNSVVLIFSTVPLMLMSLDPKVYRRFSYLNSFLSYIYASISSFVAIPFFLRGFVPKRSGGEGQEMSVRLYHIFQMLLGVVIAIPILLVFLVLFVSADQAFEELIGKIDVHITSAHVGVFILFYIFYALVAGGLVIQKLNHIVVHQNYSRTIKRGIPLIISSTVISLVALLFLVFIGVQFYYLFGDHDKVVDLGLTYSEYARRGFWELQAISIFSFGLIYALQRFTVVRSARAKLFINVLLSIFIVQVLIVLFSAHKRMSLYEDGYGFTELRFYPHVFMAYETLLFGYLVISLYAGKIFKYFSLYSYALGIAFLIGLNFVNPNQYIAKENIERYEDEDKPLDVEYLLELSPDAYIELKDVDFELKDWYRCEMLSKLEDLGKADNNWPEYNFSRRNSVEKMREMTDGLTHQSCRNMVEEEVQEFLAEYEVALKEGDYEKALEYWDIDLEDDVLITSIPEEFELEYLSLDISTDERYYSYDSFYGNDIKDDSDFRYLSDFDDYLNLYTDMHYRNSYGSYCKTDYIDLTAAKGEIKIDYSTNLPLRYREGSSAYNTAGTQISALQELGDMSFSYSCN